MKFTEIINAAAKLLRENKRMRVRTLQREFELDGDAVADLVAELVEARQLAVLEGRQILVWKSVEDEASAAASREQHEGSADEAVRGNAGHRQLTVMFCDIVGSTALVDRLDNETWRDLLQAYQTRCAEVIERFGGYVAQFLGDGILAYFGYPRAHEDSAERAVRAALGIIERLAELNKSLAHTLQLRIGLHTGQVVVDVVGSDTRQDALALGDVPHLAYRIQEEAQPDSVFVSEATYRLVRGLFDCQFVGARRLKGIGHPLSLFRITGAGVARSRFEVARTVGLSTLIGRDGECAFLRRRWGEVVNGAGQVVLLSGEPGIGKSRLLQMTADQVIDKDSTRIEFRCSSHYSNTALYPVIDHLERLLGFRREDDSATRRSRLAERLRPYDFPDDETLPVLARLLGLDEESDTAPLNMSPQRQRQRVYATLIAWIIEESQRQPVYCAFEDLHWADPSTLELLDSLVDAVAHAPILLLLTYRPEFRVPWPLRSHFTQIALGRLEASGVERLIDAVTGGRALPQAVREQIAKKTDGIPLFVEELTKAIIESSLLVRRGDHYDFEGSSRDLSIPSTLQDSLMARLDRLDDARELAQIGATIGREFGYGLIRAVAGHSESALQDGLRRLVNAELVHQRGLPPDAHYEFKHALVQDTAYLSLLSEKRQKLHKRIAGALERDFPSVCDTNPELLALHYSGAGVTERAISYWQRAGERSLQRSANIEAIEHLQRGLELVAQLPEEAARIAREFTLRALLGPALIAARGYGAPETAACFDRAYALISRDEATAEHFPVLYGCWVYNLTWADFDKAQSLSRQFLDLARERGDDSAILTGHRIVGFTQSCRGEFGAARENLSRVRELYQPRRHARLAYRYGQDPRAAAMAMLGFNLWHLGAPAEAMRCCARANALALDLEHANTRGYVETFGAGRTHVLCRDRAAVRYDVESIDKLCDEQGLVFWRGFARTYEGWLLCEEGNFDEAIDALKNADTLLQSSHTAMFRPHGLAILAQALLGSGAAAAARDVIDDALATIQRTAEYWVLAEILRLRGETYVLVGSTRSHQLDAQQCFVTALDEARRRSSRGWELRCATSLARLWESCGRRQEARELLEPVRAAFPADCITADLQDASAVLAGLQC